MSRRHYRLSIYDLNADINLSGAIVAIEFRAR